jgi:hypothetical protein
MAEKFDNKDAKKIQFSKQMELRKKSIDNASIRLQKDVVRFH